MKAPEHLKKNTKKWFLAIVNEYELELHHVKLLTLAAEAWDRCEDARLVIEKSGAFYENRFHEPRTHPAVAVERDSRLAFVRCLREVNLDIGPPDSRPPVVGK